eukprot:INCI10460.3.p1 GENE.INCI10460.3~~INCI10460.3.p1  ORF type:complete len:350 (+),score=51.05 INCI10460.3:112-1161(+)
MDFSELYEAEGQGEDEADTFAQSLKEEFARQQAEGYAPPPKCWKCKEMDQTVACLDCRRGFCAVCLDEHLEIRRFAAHRRCSLDELEQAVADDAAWRDEFREKERTRKLQVEAERRLAHVRRVQESKNKKAHVEAQARLEAIGLQISFDYTAGTKYFGNAIEAPPRRKRHPPGHPAAAAARSFGIPQECVAEMGVPIPHGKGKLYRGPPTNALMYDGQWHLGNMNGPGKYFWPDGSSWEGGFKNNRKHGRGIFRPGNPRDRVKAVYFNFDRKICEDMDLCEGVRLKLRRRGVSAPATIVKWDRKKHRHLLRFDFSDTCAWTDLSLEDFDIARTEARCIFLPQIAPDPNE